MTTLRTSIAALAVVASLSVASVARAQGTSPAPAASAMPDPSSTVTTSPAPEPAMPAAPAGGQPTMTQPGPAAMPGSSVPPPPAPPAMPGASTDLTAPGANLGPAQSVPTPAPGGTPVTFGSPAAIGSPLPVAPALPLATSVPTTSPNGHAHTYAQRRETFVVGDYLFQPKVYNELSHGEQSTIGNYGLRGATEFNLADVPLMVEGEVRRYNYVHQAGLVTNPGRASQTFVSGEQVRDDDIDGHLGIQILDPRIYVAFSYLDKRNTAGAPHVTGYGGGIEKLPDYEAPLGIYFSVYYYPNLTGQLNVATTSGMQLQTLRYRVLTYQLGLSVKPAGSPVFLDLGALGDRMTGRGGAPSNETHLSPYAGIGFFSY